MQSLQIYLLTTVLKQWGTYALDNSLIDYNQVISSIIINNKMFSFGSQIRQKIIKSQSTALKNLVLEIKQIIIDQHSSEPHSDLQIKVKQRSETPISLIEHQHDKTFVTNTKQNIKSEKNQNNRKTPISQLQTLNPEKQLLKKKKMLMEQLRFIDDQLRKVQLEKSRSKSLKSKNQTQPDQSQLFYRASSLVSRMNKQRKQTSHKKNQQFINLNNKVNNSLKQYEQMNNLKQQQRLEKRKLIQKSIEERKLKIQQRQKLNRQSNTIVSQIQNYRVSLPSVTKILSDDISNEYESNKIKHRQHFERSIFLQNVMKQEIRKKREEHFKQYERKNRRERQNQYGKKIRGYYKKQDDGVFVTKV